MDAQSQDVVVRKLERLRAVQLAGGLVLLVGGVVALVVVGTGLVRLRAAVRTLEARVASLERGGRDSSDAGGAPGVDVTVGRKAAGGSASAAAGDAGSGTTGAGSVSGDAGSDGPSEARSGGDGGARVGADRRGESGRGSGAGSDSEHGLKPRAKAPASVSGGDRAGAHPPAQRVPTANASSALPGPERSSRAGTRVGGDALAQAVAALKRALESGHEMPDDAGRREAVRQRAEALEAAYVSAGGARGPADAVSDVGSAAEVGVRAGLSSRDLDACLRWARRGRQAGRWPAGLDGAIARLASDVGEYDTALRFARLADGVGQAGADDLLFEAALDLKLGQRSEAEAALGRAATALDGDVVRCAALVLGIGSDDIRYAAGRMLLGRVLSGAGRWAEAEGVWREVVRLVPKDGGARTALGTVLLARMKDAEAVDVLAGAVRLAPDSGLARYRLGVALANTDRLDEAMASFSAAIRSGQMVAASRFARAVCLARQGREVEAEQELARALALDGGLMDAASDVPAFAEILGAGGQGP